MGFRSQFNLVNYVRTLQELSISNKHPAEEGGAGETSRKGRSSADEGFRVICPNTVLRKIGPLH